MYDIFYISSGAIAPQEWDQFKSTYPTAQKIEHVKTFSQIARLAFTKLFWVVWTEHQLLDSFDLTAYTATKWDNMYIHIFRSGNFYPGICLFPKNSIISQEQFDSRQFDNIKLVDIQASTLNPFPIYKDVSYKEYLDIYKSSSASMFWIIWDNVEILDNSVFSDYFNLESECKRNMNHVFKSIRGNVELHTTSIVLFSTCKLISEREYNYRFLLEAQYHDKLVSRTPLYDKVFISYNEPNADENYRKILSKFPDIYRVNNVKGIHNAHIEAAKMCNTDMFWVIDGDAKLHDDFNFDYMPSLHETDVVHVWHSINPINKLIYGYGGVKLLPRKLTLSMDTSPTDITTSISNKFKSMPVISNITAFDTDPYSVWRSAFRECVKLSSKVINRQVSSETNDRLNTWCTVGSDTVYGKYAIAGAKHGKAYGELHKNDAAMLKKINDFDWLYNLWISQDL